MFIIIYFFISIRWDVVAQYLSQHGPNNEPRPAKEVLNKAKELQNTSNPSKLKDAANKSSLSQITGVEKKLDKLEHQEGSSALATATERLECQSTLSTLHILRLTSYVSPLIALNKSPYTLVKLVCQSTHSTNSPYSLVKLIFITLYH